MARRFTGSVLVLPYAIVRRRAVVVVPRPAVDRRRRLQLKKFGID